MEDNQKEGKYMPYIWIQTIVKVQNCHFIFNFYS